MSKSIWSEYKGFQLRSWVDGSQTIRAGATFPRVGPEQVQFGPFANREHAIRFINNLYLDHDGDEVLKIHCEIKAD